MPPPVRGRDLTRAAITSTNVIASTNRARPGPLTLTSTPATAGPSARASVYSAELSLTASSSRWGGTSSGTKLCQAAVWMPVAQPPMNPQPTMPQGFSVPDWYQANSTKASAIWIDWVTMRILRRDTRSASTPAYGVRITAGSIVATVETPSQVAESVRSNRIAGRATICIHAPALEIAAAQKNRAKSRCRSACRAPIPDDWISAASG